MHLQREAFGYESNGFLLSQMLVPEPFERDHWERLRAVWERCGEGVSLLEWLVTSGAIEEPVLLESLAAASGARVVDNPVPAPRCAEDLPLWNSGFIVLAGPDGARRVAGGPALPPDLARFAGARAEHLEWVVISPLRDQGKAAVTAQAMESDSKTPVEERLARMLEEALANQIADLHFERGGERLRIRSHGPGGMRRLGELGPPESMQSLRILKRWANFNTAENPLPQDGRLRVPGRSGPAFRASHVAAVDGESLVLRASGSSERLPELDVLGMEVALVETLVRCLEQERGMILFTGPTGSGKTTSLCALLQQFEHAGWKVLTVEDPVEHELPFATQCAVREESGWTFAAALRAFLRQDPDVIVIGEMRDAESAAIGCRAALTGHRVLSSLHARSATEALDRLAGWGIPWGVLTESLRLIVNQRLVDDPAGPGRTGTFDALRVDAEAVARRVGPDRTG
jgi:Tfp pilus assembly pilus retraction ATPase PilT